MTPDPDHKFELALQLNKVIDAFSIAEQQGSSEKWRKVGDIALSRGNFSMAEQCFDKSGDFNSLLLFYSSYGDQKGLQRVAEQAEAQGKFNVAFEAAYLLADIDRCISVLVKSNRIGEAAFFAKAYAPSLLPEIMKKWAENLKESGLPFQPESLQISKEDLAKESSLREQYQLEREPGSSFKKLKAGYYQ